MDDSQYSLDFARDTVDLLSRAVWWSTNSNDQLNLKELQFTCNKIRNKTLTIDKRLKTTTANDILATFGQTIWSSNSTTDEQLQHSGDQRKWHGCRNFESNVLSLCSPQSRLHNWLETKERDNNQNAIVYKKEESIFRDDMKAVGYGRKHHYPEVLTYSNPFDPNLTFDGLNRHIKCKSTRGFGQYPQQERIPNIRITHYDSYLNEYHAYIKSLHDCGRHYYRPVFGKDQSGLENTKLPNESIKCTTKEEKDLASKVFNMRVKNLWPRETKRCNLKISSRTIPESSRENPDRPYIRMRQFQKQRMSPIESKMKWQQESSDLCHMSQLQRESPDLCHKIRTQQETPDFCNKIKSHRESPDLYHIMKQQQGSSDFNCSIKSRSMAKSWATCVKDEIELSDHTKSSTCPSASKQLKTGKPKSSQEMAGGTMTWWRETTADENSPNSFSLPDTFGFSSDKCHTSTTSDKVEDRDVEEARETPVSSKETEVGAIDWFSDWVRLSGLKQDTDISKDQPVDNELWETIPNMSPHWDKPTASLCNENSGCPLPLKRKISSSGQRDSTHTTSSMSSTPFCLTGQSIPRSDTNQPQPTTAHPAFSQRSSSFGGTKAPVNEVNIQQLFQAAQAGCHTVISRSMFPYSSCFYNQRPAFIPPNAPLIWQPYVNTTNSDLRCASPSLGRTNQSAEPHHLRSASSTPTSSTHGGPCFNGPETSRNVQHRQSPTVWLNKEEGMRQPVDGCHERSTDSLQPVSSGARSNALCIPVAFSIGRPSPMQPTCFTARPAIQIALTNNPPHPQFTQPFPAIYRSNCTIKNVNKNNSGAVDVELGDEMPEERTLIMHNLGMPDMFAPITVQPSLQSLQANIIQIYPTKIVYS